MKPTTQSPTGTSFHDTVIRTSVNVLRQILGEPRWSDNDGQDKTNFEWTMLNKKGDIFTVYDYKEYRPIGEDEMIEWHIGGHDKSATDLAAQEIFEAAEKLTLRVE